MSRITLKTTLVALAFVLLTGCSSTPSTPTRTQVPASKNTPETLKEEPKDEKMMEKDEETESANNESESMNDDESPTPTTTEKASGLITSVYSKSGKNYMDIDYVEFNPNWAPGGMTGPEYDNNNTKIRTFEISPSAKFLGGSPATDSITFSEFQDFFSASSNSYQKLNPWDIVITNGIVVEVKEHFVP